MSIVVDTDAAGEVDLYADADRNLKIDDRDRVVLASSSSGSRRERIWRLSLSVALVENDAVRTIPRAVVFRMGTSGLTLGYASAGFVEGKIPIGNREHGRPLAARRVDGDGNGLLADAQDRLWLDLNGDERFDPSSEQFLYASVLNLDGSRYVVLSDESGSRLALRAPGGYGHAPAGVQGKPPAEVDQKRRSARDGDQPRWIGLWPDGQRAGHRAGRGLSTGHGHAGT